jgi:hypothetical protein
MEVVVDERFQQIVEVSLDPFVLKDRLPKHLLPIEATKEKR